MRVLLFDIDGTLIRAARGRGYRREVTRVVESIFGTAGRMSEVDMAGKTDLAIISEALAPEGVPLEAVREKLHEWESGFRELVERLHREAPLFTACPGVGELLGRLEEDRRFVLSLLTGNMERTAAAKLATVGLERHFRVRGAYGGDHHDRRELPAIAARRIIEHTGRALGPSDFVIIGDTPRDVECAKHFGMHCVAVATGPFTAGQLAEHGPDAVLEDLCDAEAVLEAIGGSAGPGAGSQYEPQSGI
jgi:phosphoglycolate phosphatase